MAKSWIKLYPEMIGDPKISTLPLPTRWCWVGILCLAGQCDDGDSSGRLEWQPGSPIDDEDIAASVGVDLDTWLLARDAFLRRGMLYRDKDTYVITAYTGRQEPADKTGAERKRRQREREAGETPRDSHEDATAMSRSCHGHVTRDSHGCVTADVTAMSRVDTEAEAEAEADTDTDTDTDLPSPNGEGECEGGNKPASVSPAEESTTAAAPEAPPAPDPAPDPVPNPDPPKPQAPEPPEWAQRLAAEMDERLMALYPRRVRPKPTHVRQWAVDLDRLQRIDGQEPEEIVRVTRWALMDPFWQANAQSGRAIREHWNKLVAQAERDNGNGNGGSSGYRRINAQSGGRGQSGSGGGRGKTAEQYPVLPAATGPGKWERIRAERAAREAGAGSSPGITPVAGDERLGATRAPVGIGGAA